MQRLRLYGALLIVLATAPGIHAGGSERSGASASFDAERFYRDVRELVRRHYPDATAHRLDDKVHFEHRTRVFIVHEPLRTGEWQDPREERGPRMGGVLCDIEYRPGRYGGAAAVPQTFDKRYFRLHLLAPYSEKLDGHLYVHLKLPGNGSPPEGFQEQLTTLIDGFEAYANAE